MARGFWQERERYLETYWSRFENIWVHGDWAMKDATDIGLSWVARTILESRGQTRRTCEVESLSSRRRTSRRSRRHRRSRRDERHGDGRFLRSERRSSGKSGKRFENVVAKDMGKPLAPSKIHFVSALPKTRNAKVMRRVIRARISGEDAGDLSALENPSAVEEIRKAMNKKWNVKISRALRGCQFLPPF
jgi:acetyl-CoA synthetase